MGQANVQRHMLEVLEHIGNGKLHPDAIISHRLSLSEATRGYEIFDEEQKDCRKIVLTQ